jgi:hypothetical protein
MGRRHALICSMLLVSIPLMASGGGELSAVVHAVSGSYSDGTRSIPCFWSIMPTDSDKQQAVRTDLAGDGVHDGEATAIHVVRRDRAIGMIYVGGWYSDGNRKVACIWTVRTGWKLQGGEKQGVTRTDLPGDGVHDAMVSALAVDDDGILYAAGWYDDGSKTIACTWKGANRTDLPGDGVHDAAAAALAIGAPGRGLDSGGDKTVYAAGWYDDGGKTIACTWTGTARTDLPGDGANGAEVASIFTDRADDRISIYAVGYYLTSTSYIPCLWIGTERTDLGGAWGYATSIRGHSLGFAVSVTYRSGGTYVPVCVLYRSGQWSEQRYYEGSNIAVLSVDDGSYPDMVGNRKDNSRWTAWYLDSVGHMVPLEGDGVHDSSAYSISYAVW